MLASARPVALWGTVWESLMKLIWWNKWSDSHPADFIASTSTVVSRLQRACTTLLHLWRVPAFWCSRQGARSVCLTDVHGFAGAGAVHVFPEQGLPQDHLPQLAARLQRGTDHVLLAGGMGGGAAVAGGSHHTR